ncbi:MAG: type V CRISPR-associated endonuclease Cas1 [Candidatus Woesearchaeota archaeon]
MEKQVLFLESSEAKKISFKNSNLQVTDENGRIILQNSCHKIFLVFIRGEFTITSVLLKNAKRFGFPLVFLTYSLRPYLVYNAGTEGNFLLRRVQYSCNRSFEIAKHIVYNKVLNQVQLMKSLRYKTKEEKKAIEIIEKLLTSIKTANDEQELLGIEGESSKLFFRTYFKNINFSGRKPRIKPDIYNCLLDIGYTYLFQFIEANLSLYGFDLYCGVYHKQFYQRKSLVCDIIEPFRCVIEKRIRTSCNLKQIDEKDFVSIQGRYELKKEATQKYSEILLRAILEYKQDIFLYVRSYYRAFIKQKEIEAYPIFRIGEDR